MKKKFKISSSVTSASNYGFNCEYNKNIFQLWSMMKGWGYEEDVVTCHTFHVPCGPTQFPIHCQSMPELPAYFAVHRYHGIIPCEKNRLVLPMNGRRVKQQWSKYKSQACKACEKHDMSQYLLHILSLSSLIKTGRYSDYIHNWSHSQMLMLLKKTFWISSSFPHWYCPWIIYYFISDLFSIYFMNK